MEDLSLDLPGIHPHEFRHPKELFSAHYLQQQLEQSLVDLWIYVLYNVSRVPGLEQLFLDRKKVVDFGYQNVVLAVLYCHRVVFGDYDLGLGLIVLVAFQLVVVLQPLRALNLLFEFLHLSLDSVVNFEKLVVFGVLGCCLYMEYQSRQIVHAC